MRRPHIATLALLALLLALGQAWLPSPAIAAPGIAAPAIAAPAIAAPGDTARGAVQVARNVQFAHVTSMHGLSQEFVQAVVQDARGHIWFATQEGLNRYDGHDVVSYRHMEGDATSIPSDFIWALLVDRDGALWIATERGLARHDPSTDTFSEPLAAIGGTAALGSPRVRSLAQDRHGVFWLGTVDQGLIAVDPASRRLRRWQAPPAPDAARPAQVRSSARTAVGGSDTGFPAGAITTILPDSAGRLWVGTDGGGIARLGAGGRWVRYRHQSGLASSLADDRVRALHEDHQGRVWVGAAGGTLSLFDALSDDFRNFPLSIAAARPSASPGEGNGNGNGAGSQASAALERAGVGQISALLTDRAGTLWAATEAGLCELRADARNAICYRHDSTDATSLLNDRVNALFEDRSGVLWVGTQRGVSRWNRVSETFTYFHVANGALTNDTVTSVAEGADGSLWVGTYGGGLTRIHPGSGEIRHYRNVPGDTRSLSDDRVMTVQVDGQGGVWIGTRGGGLNRLDPRTGTVSHYRHSPTDPRTLSGDAVSALETDASGALWVGVFDGGLNRLAADGTFVRYRHDARDPHSLPADRVLDLFRDRAGRLWVGMERGGVAFVDTARDRFVRIGRARGDDEDILTAWDIEESSDGALWISTQGQGLLRWTAADRAAGKGHFRRFGRTDGLPSDTVFGALEGAPAEIWIATSRGLTALDLRTGKVRNFNQRNGLRGDEFNLGAHVRSRSGRLYFGGTDGLVAFDPGALRGNRVPPPISLTAASRDRVLARSNSDGRIPRIELGYLDPFVSFDFVGLDFVAPDSNRYRYWMEGLDADWVEAERFRRAVYTRLPPGNYVFHVQAANNDSVWNDTGAAISVHVAPPPWNTPLAYELYVLGAGVVAFWLLRRQRHKARRESNAKVELERLVHLRTREVAERVLELEQLNVQLREASLTDSLTGLRNRRYLDETMDIEVAKVERRIVERVHAASPEAVDSSHLLFLMMIDLDGFKSINDTHGHKAGDEALLQVKDILLDCCRQSDIVIRWGGDEFMIVGHVSGFDGAKTLAERIRNGIATWRFRVAGGHTCTMSASIGVVPFPFCEGRVGFCHWELTAAVADQCAYLAKSRGRNAWVSLRGSARTDVEDLHVVDLHLVERVSDGRLLLDTSMPRARLLPGPSTGEFNATADADDTTAEAR